MKMKGGATAPPFVIEYRLFSVVSSQTKQAKQSNEQVYH